MHYRTKKIPAKVSKKGCLIIVGGREDKENEKLILKEISKRNYGGTLVVATVASTVAEELWKEYYKLFSDLGIKHIEHLHIEQPDQARDPNVLKILEKAKTVFFTGGDQLKITTKLGGTPVFQRMYEIFQSGGTLAGTSAGASVMGENMLIGGENSESHKVGNWMMAPGLGFVKNLIIDQHFAQRGRIGRLLGAIALNPGVLGIGIDEDTGIIIEGDEFQVLGSNAVYVVDGTSVTYTNISEAAAENTMSMHNVRLHILSSGERFHLSTRIACIDAKGPCKDNHRRSSRTSEQNWV